MVPPEYPVELPTTPAESATAPMTAPSPPFSATVTLPAAGMMKSSLGFLGQRPRLALNPTSARGSAPLAALQSTGLDRVHWGSLVAQEHINARPYP